MATSKQLACSLKTLVTAWGRRASFPEEGTFGIREKESAPGKEKKYVTGENGGLKPWKSTVHPGNRVCRESMWNMAEKDTSQQASVNTVPSLFQPVAWSALRSTGKAEIKNGRIAKEMKVDTQVHWRVKCLRGKAVSFRTRKGWWVSLGAREVSQSPRKFLKEFGFHLLSTIGL